MSESGLRSLGITAAINVAYSLVNKRIDNWCVRAGWLLAAGWRVCVRVCLCVYVCMAAWQQCCTLPNRVAVGYGVAPPIRTVQPPTHPPTHPLTHAPNARAMCAGATWAACWAARCWPTSSGPA